jgi:hypothetical protein
MQKAFSILILGLLVAAGAGCFKKSVEPVGDEVVDQQTNEELQEGIDTSNWETYRNEKLGFEMKLPPDWDGPNEMFGPSQADENRHPFWHPILGTTFWSSETVNVGFTVKRSTSTLEEFNGGIGFFGEQNETRINGLPAYQNISPLHQSPPALYQTNEQFLIKNGDIFYFIEFSANSESLDVLTKSYNEWKESLRSFKPFQPKP